MMRLEIWQYLEIPIGNHSLVSALCVKVRWNLSGVTGTLLSGMDSNWKRSKAVNKKIHSKGIPTWEPFA